MKQPELLFALIAPRRGNNFRHNTPNHPRGRGACGDCQVSHSLWVLTQTALWHGTRPLGGPLVWGVVFAIIGVVCPSFGGDKSSVLVAL